MQHPVPAGQAGHHRRGDPGEGPTDGGDDVALGGPAVAAPAQRHRHPAHRQDAPGAPGDRGGDWDRPGVRTFILEPLIKDRKQCDHYRWVNNGGMFIAHNAVRLDEYKRLFTIGRDGKYSSVSDFIDISRI